MRAEPPTTSIGSYGMWAAAWTLLVLWERGDSSTQRMAADICRALRKLGRSARIVRPPAHFFTGCWHALAGQEKQAVRAWRATIEVDAAFEVPYFTARACSELSRSQAVAADERTAFCDRTRRVPAARRPRGPAPPRKVRRRVGRAYGSDGVIDSGT
jgi:hypothetical protein